MQGLVLGLGLLLALSADVVEAQAVDGGGPAAIVRSHDTRLTLDRDDRLRMTVRTEVEILSPDAQERHGVLVQGYDAFRSIRKLEGRILNARGETVRKLRRGDIEDYPATASYSLYEDNRVRVAQLYHDTYPYVVVWEYEIEYKGVLNWPTWHPQRSEEPVLLASLRVEVPEDEALRYLAVGLPFEPTERTVGKRTIYEWRGMLPGRLHEPLGPSGWDQFPHLYLATDRFWMAGYDGDLSSWAGLGEWYSRLADGRDELPEGARAEVVALTEGVADPRERARIVYTYLQRTVRYVSVQLGIGGWQPFPAEYVYERRYGDCKALTNYLAALLAAVDVRAFPALIGNGLVDLDPAFPRSAFNHVILFVPLPDGDLWLEATSQTIPFGYLGAGSEDRWALVVEPGSGRLVRTRSTAAEENRQVRRSELVLSASGQANARAEARYSGHPLSYLRSAFAERSEREQTEWWEDRLGLNAANLSVRARKGFGEGQVGHIETEAELPRYATAAGSRLMFRPNVFERWTSVPTETGTRLQPVELGYPFVDVDSVRVALPAGFSVEAVPEPVSIKTPFARYEAVTRIGGDTLTYTRTVAITERRLPPEDYEAYRSFVFAVVQADDAHVVLRRD